MFAIRPAEKCIKKGKVVKTKLIMAVVTAAIMSGSALYAHHSFAATYLENQQTKIEGKVAEFIFRNPHSFVHVMVTDESGTPIRWAVEWAGAGQLNQGGITAQTLKVGDTVTITGNPGRDPSEHRMRMVTLKRSSDGLEWGARSSEVVQ